MQDPRRMVWTSWTSTGCLLLLLGATGCPGDDVPTDTEGTGSTGSSSTTVEVDGSTAADDTSTSTSGSDGDGSSTGDPPPPEIDPLPDPPGLSANAFTSCRVDDDGTMTCWGDGSCGLLADGGELARAPFATATDSSWASVSSGTRHSCAIGDDRSLWCWGDGADGKVGDGVLNEGLPPTWCRYSLMEIAPGASWARLSLGDDHSCGVQTDGTLWCWGNNDSGQIGDGSVGPLYSRLEPVEVGGTAWIDVYAGHEHTCGVDGAGTVWCWGLGSHGELGVEDMTFSSVPVEVPGLPAVRELARGGTGSSTCALTMEDTLWCWGRNIFGAAGVGSEDDVFTPTEVDLGTPIAAVHMGSSTACARAEDGRLWCWGLGSSGQLGDGVVAQGHFSTTPVQAPGEDWIDLAVGREHVCGQTSDGQTLCWGDNLVGQVGDGTSGPDNGRTMPVPVGPWGGGPVASDWAVGEVGDSHGCGRRLDGSMWCWGGRKQSQLGDDDALGDCPEPNPTECASTTPVAVTPAGTGAWGDPELGAEHTCALQDDGTLWCWGQNLQSQLGYSGDDGAIPTRVGMATNWTAVSLGQISTCGLRSPGTLWCWGGNSDGVLGNGMIGGSEPAPVQVGIETDWVSIEVGSFLHACGIRSDQSLWCWGRNDYGQLGLGSVGDPEPTPVQVPGSWASVSAGAFHTCAIAVDGTLWCWGRAGDGELGIGPVAEDATIPSPTQVGADSDWNQVALGGRLSCGRRGLGTVWCWGNNDRGQLGQGTIGVPPMADVPLQVGADADWVDLSVASAIACGRRGTDLWCWGSNSFGGQGNDTIFSSGTLQQVRDDG